MLGISRGIARVIVSATESKASSLLRTQTPSISPLLPQSALLKSRLSNLAVPASRLASNRQYVTFPEPVEVKNWLTRSLDRLLDTSRTSMRKIFAPPGSSSTHRVLAGLNRFGPLTSFNPLFLWKLQTSFRPYVTMAISLTASLAFLSTSLGTTDSTMRLVAVPARIWSGDESRLFTSSFIHTHFFHLASLSGFFLAFSTAVEVAAGPVTLLAVLLSAAVVGTAAAICAPERNPNLYIEKVQMGLWPAVAGLASFFWYGLRKEPPAYLRNNPNLTSVEKLAARQLTSTLSQRKLPLIALALLALAPLPGVESTAFGSIAGGLTGAALGFMYTRSPHLVLINGLLAGGVMTYLAQRPAWTLNYQAFKFARSWEDGDFIRAREWLNMFSDQSKKVSAGKDIQAWTMASLALVEMACGRTTVAMNYANNVDPSRLVLKSDLLNIRDQLAGEWRAANRAEDANSRNNIRFGSLTSILDPSKLKSMKQYQLAFRHAPWRIMNDEKILMLYLSTFAAQPSLSPPEMQELILQHYRGLFNFDPTYSRSFSFNDPHKLPSHVRDNPLQ